MCSGASGAGSAGGAGSNGGGGVGGVGGGHGGHGGHGSNSVGSNAGKSSNVGKSGNVGKSERGKAQTKTNFSAARANAKERGKCHHDRAKATRNHNKDKYSRANRCHEMKVQNFRAKVMDCHSRKTQLYNDGGSDDSWYRRLEKDNKVYRENQIKNELEIIKRYRKRLTKGVEALEKLYKETFNEEFNRESSKKVSEEYFKLLKLSNSMAHIRR